MTYEELCYSLKVRYHEVHEYLNLLLRRKRIIESVIDDHFFLIKEIITRKQKTYHVREVTKDNDSKKEMRNAQEKLKGGDRRGGGTSSNAGLTTHRSNASKSEMASQSNYSKKMGAENSARSRSA